MRSALNLGNAWAKSDMWSFVQPQLLNLGDVCDRANEFEHDENYVLQRCGRMSCWLLWSVISWCGA